MIVEIQYLPRLAAETYPGDIRTVVISIQTPGQAPAELSPGFGDILRLWFDDLSETLWTDLAKRPVVPDEGRDGGPVDTLGFIWFDTRLADIVRLFIQEYHERPEPFKLLVHCEAGQSRSAAVALWAATYTGTALTFDDEARRLLNDRVLRLLQRPSNPNLR